MEPDWSSIIPDIGNVILCKLHEFVDQVRFGAVCKNWYSITKEYDQLTRPSRGTLPMLFIPSNECETQRKLYNMSNKRVYHNVTLSDIPNKRCCGSSYGWLAFMEEDLSVTLINPFKFKGITIHLPIIKADGIVSYAYADVITKLIVSPNSTPDNYTVVAIYGGYNQLAIFRNEDNRWTYIVNKNLFNRKVVTLSDIMFHKGSLYAVCHTFKVFSININVQPIRIKILKQKEPPLEQTSHKYFVESTYGDLYVLKRERDINYVTEFFKVLKLEFHQKNGSVVRVVEKKTLDGDSVFLNETYSVAIKASNFDWIQPNSIYYMQDKDTDTDTATGDFPYHDSEDTGIYNVEDKSITRMYLRDPTHIHRPDAIWVHPLSTIRNQD